MIDLINMIWNVFTFGMYDLNSIETMPLTLFFAISLGCYVLWHLLIAFVSGVVAYVGLNL